MQKEKTSGGEGRALVWSWVCMQEVCKNSCQLAFVKEQNVLLNLKLDFACCKYKQYYLNLTNFTFVFEYRKIDLLSLVTI